MQFCCHNGLLMIHQDLHDRPGNREKIVTAQTKIFCMVHITKHLRTEWIIVELLFRLQMILLWPAENLTLFNYD